MDDSSGFERAFDVSKRGRSGRRGRGHPGGRGHRDKRSEQTRESRAKEERERLEREAQERSQREEAELRAKEEAEKLDAIKDATARMRELTRAARSKRELRLANLSPNRPDETQLRALDSSVKRNTALIKRLRQVGEDGNESLSEDLKRANQSKYVSEAVQAIVESQMKPRHVSAVVQVCSVLHQRYAEFSGQLVSSLADLFGSDQKPLEENTAKRRTALRLLADLLYCGVHSEAELLLGIVRDLVPSETDRAKMHASLPVLSSLAKSCRRELLGAPATAPPAPEEHSSTEVCGEQSAVLVAAKEELDKAREEYAEEAERAYALPERVTKQFAEVMDAAFNKAAKALVAEHRRLLKQEKENANMLSTKGELSEEAASAYEKLRKEYDALHRNVSTLAESLDREMPELKAEEDTPQEGAAQEAGTIGVLSGKATEAEGSQVFDDEDTRAFYESLPDLRSLVPAVLLQDADQEGAAAAASEGKAGGGEAVSGKLEMLLMRLPACVSRDLCDEFSLDFCYHNSKAARKNLVQALVEVPRGAMQLLPHFARITASLAPVFPDVLQGVLSGVERKVEALLARKESSLEARTRYMQYTGELCKFRLIPYGTIFHLFKALLDNFSPPNIEAMCSLLECAGRFLYKNPETSSRMVNMLEIMMRIKNARSLDGRLSSLVDSAYYQCCPPERSAAVAKKRPPEHEWIRHLVYDQLTQDSIQWVMKKLRKLPWQEFEPYLIKCLLKVVRGRYSQIPLVASLASGLSKYHDTLGIALVDSVLEHIHQGLERPSTGQYQLRVAHVRLLGEMYNYRLVNSRVIFDTLHLIVSFVDEGAGQAGEAVLEHALFRIRLVCTLLSACGQYFDRGPSKRRLDQFLVLFQHFCLWLAPLPLDVEYDVDDLLSSLRPRMRRFSTLEEATEALHGAHGGAASGAEEDRAGAADAQGEDDRSESASSAAESDDSGGAGKDRSGQPPAESMDEDTDGNCSDGAILMNDDDSEEVNVRRPVVEQELDEDFEAQFRAVMQEMTGIRGAPAAAAAPPPVLSAKASGKQGAGQDDADSAVSFKFLMKRAGKDDRTRELQVPLNSAMAVNARKKGEAEAEERNEIKRLVLEASKREEEEIRAAERASRVQQGRHQGGGKGSGPRGAPAPQRGPSLPDDFMGL
uniref:Regulator of nonsense transcripts 2 n=1 Tax=Tetraselmis sp. GSL018 TaxID=582737 RepID=A0A061R4F1_9CHLO|eukprot:CAMPEP_0177615126 /NCGR_PEP_ID=MMETSP0419_2-20121207/23216_1 /TAXON_ID=582737 /ORGANISM="Tetraselmis sp., Strain GSL018" /LENGTH=1152 /DNA_ID=CAMNT_0019112617 /DNA_START=78 /DNA_END=3536 /DNA_ORIENTATION=+